MSVFLEIDERVGALIMVAIGLVGLAVAAPGLFDQLVVGPLETLIDAITGAY
jgi:hypothetical protein